MDFISNVLDVCTHWHSISFHFAFTAIFTNTCPGCTVTYVRAHFMLTMMPCNSLISFLRLTGPVIDINNTNNIVKCIKLYYKLNILSYNIIVIYL